MRTLAVVISFFVVLFAPVMAYSHCHNDAAYEHPNTVRGNLVWPPEIKNDQGIYEIEFQVNKDYPGKPSLETPAQDAAREWSERSFLGRTIKWKTVYDGRASIDHLDALALDDINIVAWYNLKRTGPPAKARIYHSGNRINEVDVVLNYYYDYTNHANAGSYPAYYCTLDVLCHEFGHQAGLMDVYYEPSGSDNKKWCTHYQHYTMNGTSPGGEHFRETLRCEDKYALDQKYSFSP